MKYKTVASVICCGEFHGGEIEPGEFHGGGVDLDLLHRSSEKSLLSEAGDGEAPEAGADTRTADHNSSVKAEGDRSPKGDDDND